MPDPGAAGSPPVVLTIAGSDPSSGAGLQLDLAVIEALGARGVAVAAVHTVQDEGGLQAVTAADPVGVRSEIDAAFDAHRPAAVKLGALGTAAVVRAVAEALEAHGPLPVVCDPGGAATRARPGVHLLEPAGWTPLRDRLLPLCSLVTPNVAEAGALTGGDARTDKELEAAGQRILALGAGAVLLKGGHRDAGSAVVRDRLLESGGGAVWLDSERIPGATEVHGTGCALSSAIAVFLARGFSVRRACEEARSVLQRWLRSDSGGRLVPTP